MRKKEKQLIAKMIEKQAILTQSLYKYMKVIGEEIEQELDKAMMFDEILDYIGVPPDNTLDINCESPDTFCRDDYYNALYEIKSFAEALKWLNGEFVFLAQLADCGGIAKWRERYEKKE